MNIYPDDKESVYYIELNDEKNEVTLYRRHFFMPHEEFKKLKESGDHHPFITNEGHPYQIFRLPLPPLGCVPDVSWYKWMVNRLNSLA
jgi:hypothetical protein